MTESEKIDQTNYIVWPNDSVDELARDDSGATWSGTLPGIYAQLREAGFPLCGGDDSHYAEVLDFAVRDDGSVIAFTSGDEPREHSMPTEAVAAFLERWRVND